jgi:hypothetical protein
MTDIRTVLREAAPEPRAELDLAMVARQARHRRRAMAPIRAGAAVTSLACILGVAILLGITSSGPPRHQVVIAPSSVPPPPGSDLLLTVTATRMTEVSAVTGAPLRTVTLRPSLAQGPFGPVAVSALTHTAYVAETLGPACHLNMIAGVNLDTGRVTRVATGAYWPEVSPDGRQLAYVLYSGSNCEPNAVVVQDLTSGDVRGWTLPPSSLVQSVHWELDGRHLLLGGFSGSGISILDTAAPNGPREPLPFYAIPSVSGPPVHYASPVMDAQGQIVAFAPPCWGGVSCPGGFEQGTPVVALDPVTGTVRSTIVDRSTDRNLQLSDILTDSAGRILGVTGGPGGPDHLYKVVGGRLAPFLAPVSAVGWLPATALPRGTPSGSSLPSTSATTSPSTTIASAPTSKACPSGHLTATASQGSGAGGHEAVVVVVTNTGGDACTLDGYPSSTWFVAAGGDRLPGQVVEQATAPPNLVTLAAGGKASTTVWSTSTGVPPASYCHPTTTSGISVVPPGQTSGVFASIRATVCASNNVLGTTPFTSGSSESMF